MPLSTCTVSGVLYDATGAALANEPLVIVPRDWAVGADGIVVPDTITTTTNGSGNISVVLGRQAIYTVQTNRPNIVGRRTFVISVPNAATADIELIADFTNASRQAEFLDGTAGNPTFSFVNDTDTGLFLKSSNTIGISTGGTERASVDSNGLTATGLLVGNGSAATPAVRFSSDLNTGLYRISEDVLGLSVGGSEIARLTSAGMQLTGALSGSAVMSSAVDTTAGAVARVFSSGGLFGWGTSGSGSPTTITNLDDPAVPAGVWRIQPEPTTTGTRPSGIGSAAFGVVLIQHGTAGSSVSQIAYQSGGAEFRLWTRKYTGGAWTSWQYLLTDDLLTTSTTDATVGRILRVGDFGVGTSGNAPLLVTLDEPNLATGFYRSDNSTVGTFPAGADKIGTLLVASSTTTAHQQEYAETLTARRWRRRYRSASSPQFSPWRLVYDQNSVLGTVSQDAGIPTGFLIEMGSNANGRYTRFADGTQICTRTASSVAAADTPITWPAAFINSIYSVTLTTTNNSAQYAGCGDKTSTTFIPRLWSSAGARVSGNADIVAIGSWF